MRAKWVALKAKLARLRARRRAVAGRRPGSPALFVIAMATVLGVGWASDHNSCLRQIPVRREINQRDANAHILARQLHLPALARNSSTVKLPDCDKLFPDR